MLRMGGPAFAVRLSALPLSLHTASGTPCGGAPILTAVGMRMRHHESFAESSYSRSSG